MELYLKGLLHRDLTVKFKTRHSRRMALYKKLGLDKSFYL